MIVAGRDRERCDAAGCCDPARWPSARLEPEDLTRWWRTNIYCTNTSRSAKQQVLYWLAHFGTPARPKGAWARGGWFSGWSWMGSRWEPVAECASNASWVGASALFPSAGGHGAGEQEQSQGSHSQGWAMRWAGLCRRPSCVCSSVPSPRRPAPRG